MTEHEDTYSRNAQVWHYTNARINELIQEAEQALEFRDRQEAQWSPHQPPEDSLIPPGQIKRATLPEEDLGQTVQGPQEPSSPIPKKEQKRGNKGLHLSHHFRHIENLKMKKESQLLMQLNR